MISLRFLEKFDTSKGFPFVDQKPYPDPFDVQKIGTNNRGFLKELDEAYLLFDI
jgi:hypothetical protein